MREKYKIEVILVNPIEHQWLLHRNNGIAWKVIKSGKRSTADAAWAEAYAAYNAVQEK